MANYDITSKDFALSEQGVHLLRNRFNHKTIPFTEIKKAEFVKGADTNNIVVTLIVGVLLFVFAVYQTIGVFEDFNDPSLYHIYIEEILLPVLPFLVSLYCIYVVLKKVPLLIIVDGKGKYKLSLRDFIKAGSIYTLEDYLQKKLSERFY